MSTSSKEAKASSSEKPKETQAQAAQRILGETLNREYNKDAHGDRDVRHGVLLLNAISEAQVMRAVGVSDTKQFKSLPKLLASTIDYMSEVAFGEANSSRMERYSDLMGKSKTAAQLIIDDEYTAKAVAKAFIGFRAAVEIYEHGAPSTEKLEEDYNNAFKKILDYAAQAKDQASKETGT